MKKGAYIKRSLKYIGLPLGLSILMLLVLPLVLANQRTLELTNLDIRSQLQATLFAEKISGKLNTLEVLLESLAQQTRLLDLSTKSGEERLERIIRQNQLIFSEVEGVYILDTQGEKQFSSLYHTSEELDALRMSMAKQHIGQELPFCSEPFLLEGELYLSLSRSVTDSSGEIARIIALIIKTNHLYEQMDFIAIPGVEQILVSDIEDSIIVFWSTDPLQKTSPLTVEELYPDYASTKNAFSSTTLQGGIHSYSTKGKLYTFASLAEFPYTLTMKGDIKKAMGSYDKALFISSSFLLAMVLVAVIAITRLSFTITKKELEQEKILAGLAQTIQERTHELELLSEQDALTTLPNRRKMNELLMYEIGRSRETQSVFSLLILDIDFFKQVNDTYGHQTGDSVIKNIVQTLTPILAGKGTLARWGGDELMALLPDHTLGQAVDIARQMCTTVDMKIFPQDIRTSLSIGVTQFDQEDTNITLIRRADMALYNAKDAGRNQVSSL